MTVASPLERLAPKRLVWWLLSRARSRWALRLIALPLLGRLVHAVSHRVWPKGRRAWVAVEAGPARGLELLLDVRYDAKSWLGRIEPELQARLPELVQPGAVVWDVGAHTGFFTLLLARLTGEHGRVVAFEPDDESLGALVAAVERNGFANVEVRPVAVWSAPGTVGFERRSDAEGGAHGAVLLERGTVEVAATTLDEEAATGPPPSLVKIDVEGGRSTSCSGRRDFSRNGGRPSCARYTRRGAATRTCSRASTGSSRGRDTTSRSSIRAGAPFTCWLGRGDSSSFTPRAGSRRSCINVGVARADEHDGQLRTGLSTLARRASATTNGAAK